MDQLIPIINELQDTYSKLKMPFLDLPQIVIIGSQSAGKSSVLENIVRQEFLPRGTGIVTRCPLILHLVHDADSSKPTRGKFLHKEDVEFLDFNKIKDEIIRQTDVLAGPDKNISDQPIILKVFSHDFPNLTLIDLPGLTKVAVESQPKDIDQQIKNTCMKFAQKENSIILAISTANVDLANSDSLRFAEEVDPEGKRTLCVLTKLDLMDRGTNAYQILTGKVLPKQLGYVGVVSRSQEDIMKGKPIDEALKEENSFFVKNYPDLADNCGTAFLTKRLNVLLKQHIQKCLPSLRDTIKDKIRETNRTLDILGPDLADNRLIIAQYLSNFTKAYTDLNDGNFEENFTEIRGGALISDIIYEKFPAILMELEIEVYLTDEVIMGAIKNTCGPDKMTFSRQKAFVSLVREQIQKLLEPSLKCIDDVYETMKDFVKQVGLSIIYANYPNLIDRIMSETYNLITDSYVNTTRLVENLISSEKTDVFCSHPNFRLGFALSNMNFKNEDGNCEEIPVITEKELLLESGFRMVCNNIEKNIKIFNGLYMYFIERSGQKMSLIHLFQNDEVSPKEKLPMFESILDVIFRYNPSIMEYKDSIINAMVNPKVGFYGELIQNHLNCDLNKLTELRTTVNKNHEFEILRSLVSEYFTMVRQNIIYYIPKLIKTFLVIFVRDKMMNYLQLIYIDPNMDFILYEPENTYNRRKDIKTLLGELENVKKRIDEFYKI